MAEDFLPAETSAGRSEAVSHLPALLETLSTVCCWACLGCTDWHGSGETSEPPDEHKLLVNRLENLDWQELEIVVSQMTLGIEVDSCHSQCYSVTSNFSIASPGGSCQLTLRIETKSPALAMFRFNDCETGLREASGWLEMLGRIGEGKPPRLSSALSFLLPFDLGI